MVEHLPRNSMTKGSNPATATVTEKMKGGKRSVKHEQVWYFGCWPSLYVPSFISDLFDAKWPNITTF